MLLAVAGVKVQNLLEFRHKIAYVPLLTGVFLSYLEFQHDICVLEPTKQWVNRLPDLEIYRTVLDLQYDVIIKLAVKTDKVYIALGGAVGHIIPPVLLAVVNKASPNDDSAVGFYGSRQHISAVGVQTVRTRPRNPPLQGSLRSRGYRHKSKRRHPPTSG